MNRQTFFLKLRAALLSLLMAFLAMPVWANGYGSYDPETKTLTVYSELWRDHPDAGSDYTQATTLIIDGAKEIWTNTFLNCPNLKKIIIRAADNLLRVYEGAFPKSIEEIESYRVVYPHRGYPDGFYDFTNLKKVKFAGNVNEISSYLFRGCTNLTTVDLSGITASFQIYHNAFLGCTALSSIVIPNTVTFIDGEAFRGCTNLDYALVGNPQANVSDNAFEPQTNVLFLTNTNPTFEQWAGSFKGQLHDVTQLYVFNDAIANQGHNLYNNFPNVTKLKFGPNVTTIGANTFSDPNSKLTHVDLGEANVNIQTAAFAENPKLTTLSINSNNCKVDGVINASLVPIFPNVTTLNLGKKCTRVPDGIFASYIGTTIPSKLQTVNINNEYYVYVGDRSFYNCQALTTVNGNVGGRIGTLAFAFTSISAINISTLGDGGMGESAFSGCQNLSEVYLPEAGRSFDIPASAFVNCTSLEELTLTPQVQSVAQNAFSSCTNLTNLIVNSKDVAHSSSGNADLLNGRFPYVTKLVIGDEITQIDANFFANNDALKELVLGVNTATIDQSAFSSNTNLTDVSIYNHAFLNQNFDSQTNTIHHYFPYLEKVIVGSGVTSIGASAFDASEIAPDGQDYGNVPLRSVTLRGYTRIEADAFFWCQNLASISNVRSVGARSFEGTAIKQIDIYSDDCIDEGAFRNCDKLEMVTMKNNTITAIGKEAFFGCTSLKYFDIPASVKSIGEKAFNGCTSLENLVCRGAVIDLTDDMKVFSGVKNCELTVDAWHLHDYRTAPVWKDFYDIFALDGVKLQDGMAYTRNSDNRISLIRFTRTFSETHANKWQAFLIPFDLNVEDYAEDFDFAQIYAICPTKDTNGNGEIDDNDNKVMILSYKRSGTTSANVPYMIRPKRALTAKFETEGGTLYKAESHAVVFSSSVTRYSVNGIYNSFVAMPGDHNYYMGGGVLSCATVETGNETIAPYRWYMHEENQNYGGVDNNTNSSAASQIRICVLGEDLDEETAIRLISGDAISSTPVADTYIYNLNGTRVDENAPLAKGMYIKNGKTIFVK